jgi:hypothetical protein
VSEIPGNPHPAHRLASFTTRVDALVEVTEYGHRDDDLFAAETEATCAGCGAQRRYVWERWPDPDADVTVPARQAAAEAETAARAWAAAHAQSCP